MWKPIQKANELRQHCVNDSKGVGVAKTGELYIYDFEKETPQKITVQEAMNILGVSADIVAEVVKTGGKFKVEPVFEPTPEPKPEPEENEVEEEDENENEVEDKEEVIVIIEKPEATLNMVYDLLLEINRKL